MQGASLYAILALFICASAWTCQADDIIQPCTLQVDGEKSEDVVDEQDSVSMDEGDMLRIYIPGAEQYNVIGSSLLFCDDQDVEIELADDKKSYIVQRQSNSSQDSYYWIKLNRDEQPNPPPVTLKKSWPALRKQRKNRRQ